MKRTMLIAALTPALMALTLNFSTPAALAGPTTTPGVTTTSQQLAIAHTVMVPVNGFSEEVYLTGMFHVVTHVTVNAETILRLYTNLAKVQGVGTMTGFMYRATGANHLVVPANGAAPEVTLTYSLHMVPPDPSQPPDPFFPLDITIKLDSAESQPPFTNISIESVVVPSCLPFIDC